MMMVGRGGGDRTQQPHWGAVVCVERLPREHMRHRGAGEALVKAIEAAVKGDDFVLVE